MAAFLSATSGTHQLGVPLKIGSSRQLGLEKKIAARAVVNQRETLGWSAESSLICELR